MRRHRWRSRIWQGRKPVTEGKQEAQIHSHPATASRQATKHTYAAKRRLGMKQEPAIFGEQQRESTGKQAPARKRNHAVQALTERVARRVRLPVLLATEEVEVEVIAGESGVSGVDRSEFANEVLRLEWQVRDLNCQVQVPSEKLFVRGVLVADLEIDAEEKIDDVRSVRLELPFAGAKEVHFHTPPQSSAPRELRTYLLVNPANGDITTHWEQRDSNTPPLFCELRSFAIVSTQQARELQAALTLTLDIYQWQLVPMDAKIR